MTIVRTASMDNRALLVLTFLDKETVLRYPKVVPLSKYNLALEMHGIRG